MVKYSTNDANELPVLEKRSTLSKGNSFKLRYRDLSLLQVLVIDSPQALRNPKLLYRPEIRKEKQNQRKHIRRFGFCFPHYVQCSYV